MASLGPDPLPLQACVLIGHRYAFNRCGFSPHTVSGRLLRWANPGSREGANLPEAGVTATFQRRGGGLFSRTFRNVALGAGGPVGRSLETLAVVLVGVLVESGLKLESPESPGEACGPT